MDVVVSSVKKLGSAIDGVWVGALRGCMVLCEVLMGFGVMRRARKHTHTIKCGTCHHTQTPTVS